MDGEGVSWTGVKGGLWEKDSAMACDSKILDLVWRAIGVDILPDLEGFWYLVALVRRGVYGEWITDLVEEILEECVLERVRWDNGGV